jgi:hypothetical protein
MIQAVTLFGDNWSNFQAIAIPLSHSVFEQLWFPIFLVNEQADKRDLVKAKQKKIL